MYSAQKGTLCHKPHPQVCPPLTKSWKWFELRDILTIYSQKKMGDCCLLGSISKLKNQKTVTQHPNEQKCYFIFVSSINFVLRKKPTIKQNQNQVLGDSEVGRGGVRRAASRKWQACTRTNTHFRLINTGYICWNQIFRRVELHKK